MDNTSNGTGGRSFSNTCFSARSKPVTRNQELPRGAQRRTRSISIRFRDCPASTPGSIPEYVEIGESEMQ